MTPGGVDLPPTALVEAALGEATGGMPVIVSRIEHLAPWCVMRCHLAGGGSVIVKWVRTQSTDERTQPERLGIERVALQFVADLMPTDPLAPKVLASEVPESACTGSRRFLVLEDLLPRVPLRAVLLRDGAAAAIEPLTDFARTLGRLHATTAGRADEYYARQSAEGLADRNRAHDLGGSIGQWRDGLNLIATAGAPMPPAAKAELDAVIDELLHPGPFLALTNGDSESNNFLVDSRPPHPGSEVDGRLDGRLIDFESAAYQHALIDAAGLYVPGVMWMRVTDPARNGLEAAYRSALAAVVPEVSDDARYRFGIAGAGIVWALRRLAAMPKLDLRPPGESGRLHRRVVVATAAEVAERLGVFPRLAGWAREADEVLRRRWPDTAVDITSFEPYSTR